MLFKLLMLLASLFSLLAGAVFPAAPLAEVLEEPADSASFITTERLITRSTTGADFGRISVVWADMNDRRLDEDAWGTGTLESVTFKVGLRPGDGRALRVGSQSFDLKPTDTITIRDFHGRFAIAGAGSPEMTIALDGTVKTTTFKDGRVRAVITSGDGESSRAVLDPSVVAQDTRNRVAYVVLGGKEVDTVSVDTNVARSVSTRDLTASRQNVSSEQASSILARWVKIDGEIVREYRWGEGPIASLVFAVADNAGDVRVSYNKGEIPLKPAQVVRVTNFLGTYVLFQVKDGFKIKLDGFAEFVTTDDSNPLGDLSGNLAPRARYGWTPANPTTSDTVQFVDYSVDDDGSIVLRTWNFGDGPVASYPQVDGVTPNAPRYRYQRAGTYEVALTVTDNNIATDTLYQNLTVLNTPPVAAFDWAPKRPATHEAIQFFDKSWDADGRITGWSWDFGDGTPPVTLRDPKHTYASNGKYNATLTVYDTDGGTARVSQVVRVLNLPPLADFRWLPLNPRAGESTNFFDASTDSDGVIVAWRWEFNTNPPIVHTTETPSITFPTSGTFRVKLTVTDDDGGTGSAWRNVTVANRGPVAAWRVQSPALPVTGDPVQFEDLSVDVDGRIVSWLWDFGDGSTSTVPNPQHAYAANLTYKVRLTVTDNLGASAWEERNLTIGNAAPRAGFVYRPANPLSRDTVLFTDESTDADGAATLARWDWDFGDGNTSTERFPVWAYPRSGIYEVSLTVTDDKGNSGQVRKPIHVLNRAPTATFTLTPARPLALEPVQFVSTASDSDGFIVSYLWDFMEGTSSTQNAVHVFNRSGTYPVTLTVVDNDGGVATFSLDVIVLHAAPRADFNWTPVIPSANVPVQFTDLSAATEGNLVNWAWTFGDGARSSVASPTYAYPRAGTYTVRLIVTDSSGATAFATKNLTVNEPPVASFAVLPVAPLIRQPTNFRSTATDSDGLISTYQWDIDGLLLYGREVNHTFTQPGTGRVTHTVVDDDGGVASTTRTFSIRNSPPLANFNVSARPAQGNSTFFMDRSTDSDGTITNWTWTFGDNAVSAAQHPSHVYTQNGYFATRLTVTDNDGGLGTASRISRVVANFAKVIEFRVVYPDGQPVNLSRVDLSLEGVTSTGERFLRPAMNLSTGQNGVGRITLPAYTWAAGESIAVYARVAGATSSTRDVRLIFDVAAGFERLSRDIVLDMAFTTKVTIDRSASPGFVDFANYGSSVVVYGNQSERVNFGVKVTWMDGFPVRNATVFPRISYNPFWGNVLDLGQGTTLFTQSPPQNVTDVNGAQRFSVPYHVRNTVQNGVISVPSVSPVPLTLAIPGIYLPGAYRIDATAQLGGLASVGSARFYEDPFGVVTGVFSEPV